MYRLSKNKRKRIAKLYNDGCPVKDIASLVRVSLCSVYRYSGHTKYERYSYAFDKNWLPKHLRMRVEKYGKSEGDRA